MTPSLEFPWDSRVYDLSGLYIWNCFMALFTGPFPSFCFALFQSISFSLKLDYVLFLVLVPQQKDLTQ